LPEDNHVTLTNVGLDTLVIEDIEQEGVSFTLAHDLSFPLELEPGSRDGGGLHLRSRRTTSSTAPRSA
jgi:hypothetical protein